MNLTKSIQLVIFVFLLSITLTKCALADDYIIRGGTAILNGAPSGTAKYFGLRKESHEIDAVYTAVELGGWKDNGNQGRKSSLLGKAQIGLKPGQDTGVYAKLFTGVAAISSPDTMLGSIPQFATDIGFGIRDDRSAVGISYMHVSNAGLFSKINKGRDFVLISGSIRF